MFKHLKKIQMRPGKGKPGQGVENYYWEGVRGEKVGGFAMCGRDIFLIQIRVFRAHVRFASRKLRKVMSNKKPRSAAKNDQGGVYSPGNLTAAWCPVSCSSETWRKSSPYHTAQQYGGSLKLKIELPYDPAIPLLDIYQEKMKTLIWKNTCTPMFIAALFTIA